MILAKFLTYICPHLYIVSNRSSCYIGVVLSGFQLTVNCLVKDTLASLFLFFLWWQYDLCWKWFTSCLFLREYRQVYVCWLSSKIYLFFLKFLCIIFAMRLASISCLISLQKIFYYVNLLHSSVSHWASFGVFIALWLLLMWLFAVLLLGNFMCWCCLLFFARWQLFALTLYIIAAVFQSNWDQSHVDWLVMYHLMQYAFWLFI